MHFKAEQDFINEIFLHNEKNRTFPGILQRG